MRFSEGKMTKKTGRPSKYSEELAKNILTRIENGESLRAVCADDDMPDCRTVFRWLDDNQEFCQQYARARERQADYLAEQIIEIADDKADDYIDTPNGKVLNSEHVNRSRLRVDARKWFASKVAPKKYGDKISSEITGADGKDLVVNIIRGVPIETSTSN